MHHEDLDILLTNDDGIHSKGLKCLWEALKEEANLHVAAPMDEQSGSSAGVTFGRPLIARRSDVYATTPAWMIDGKPADCVKLALQKLLIRKPDFVVSGVNHGSNAGRNVLYSGTVGATIEGVMRGIPGIAFSYTSEDVQDFPHIKSYIRKIFRYLLKHPLPTGSILNVNFPSLPADQIKGCKMARQGYRSWLGTPQKSPSSSEGESHFYFGTDDHRFDEHQESDISLLEAGFITAVPLMVGELTHHVHLSQKKEIFESYLEET